MGYFFYVNGWKTGSTIFFDGLGFRDTYYGATGAVVLVGGGGLFWASGASSASYGRCLYFNSGNVYPQNTDRRSNGFSVRSVKE